jgi:GTP-binding protein LepA
MRDYEVKEVGCFNPRPFKVPLLSAGETGYLLANIKQASDIRIGETITSTERPATQPLPGFKEFRPMVFAGLYPVDGNDYEHLKASIEKLSLNDSSFVHSPESSAALGFGFRCGFLGLLHMEIIQERLRREYDLDIISTYPSVIYRIFLRDGTMVEVDNPIKLPDLSQVDHMEEPMITAFVLCQNEIIGDMLHIVMDRRGEITKTESLDSKRVMLTCTLPLNEILLDFHDRLKSVSRGYASMDYEPAGYREADLVKMDILVHGEVVEAFSCVLHRDKAAIRGHQICSKLKDIVPAQMFNVALQAAIGGKIIARETIKGARKDVTSKCYGGDITRKRKLLEKQKEGKKKMKQIGSVSLPQEAFIAVLKTGD